MTYTVKAIRIVVGGCPEEKHRQWMIKLNRRLQGKREFPGPSTANETAPDKNYTGTLN